MTMYERSYGYKYHEGTECGNPACDHTEHLKRPQWESAAEIAKKIRADIKQAVSEGLLRAEATYSVTSESFSGGQAINIEVKGWTDAWTPCEGIEPGSKRTNPDGSWTATACRNHWCKANNDSPHATEHFVLNEEAQAAQAALMTLERIHGAYNYDGSEVQVDYFDVRYYGSVKFQDASSERFWAEEKAKKAAKRAAIDEAAKQGTRRVKVYKRDGSSTVHAAAEVNGRLVLVCGARLWRSSLTGEARSGEAEITCSRCKKRATS